MLRVSVSSTTASIITGQNRLRRSLHDGVECSRPASMALSTVVAWNAPAAMVPKSSSTKVDDQTRHRSSRGNRPTMKLVRLRRTISHSARDEDEAHHPEAEVEERSAQHHGDARRSTSC